MHLCEKTSKIQIGKRIRIQIGANSGSWSKNLQSLWIHNTACKLYVARYVYVYCHISSSFLTTFIYCKWNTFYLWGKILPGTNDIKMRQAILNKNQTMPSRQEPVLHLSPGKGAPWFAESNTIRVKNYISPSTLCRSLLTFSSFVSFSMYFPPFLPLLCSPLSLTWNSSSSFLSCLLK